MWESKKFNELLKPDSGYRTTDLLLLSYSMNPHYVQTAIKDTGIHHTYKNEIDMAEHILCVLQEDRAPGAWDDCYVNTLTQCLLYKGRILGFPHNGKSFHPKLAVMVMQDAEKKQRVRLVIGSRNLTSQNYLEAAICLEGDVKNADDGTNDTPGIVCDPSGLVKLLETTVSGIDVNFWKTIQYCISSADYTESIHRIDPDITKLDILAGGDGMPGFGSFCTDWASAKRAVILSPFISVSHLKDYLIGMNHKEVHIYANPSDYTKDMERLLNSQNLNSQKNVTFKVCARPQSNGEADDGEADEPAADGVFLHAKVYAMDLEHRSVLYIGSANFSENGFARNYELLVRIEKNCNSADSFVAALKDKMKDCTAAPAKIWESGGEEIEPQPLPKLPKVVEAQLEKLRERYENEQEQENLTEFVYELFGETVRGAPIDFAAKRLLEMSVDDFGRLRERLENTVAHGDQAKALKKELKTALEHFDYGMIDSSEDA